MKLQVAKTEFRYRLDPGLLEKLKETQSHTSVDTCSWNTVKNLNYPTRNTCDLA